MSYTLTDVRRLNSGNFESVIATLNIDSLANANTEPFDPTATFDQFESIMGVSVLGVENADSYTVEWDHLADALTVLNADGTDPTATTDVGEVVVRVDGNPGPGA